MRAAARLHVVRMPNCARTQIARLRSDPPLVLRPSIETGRDPWPAWRLSESCPARVSLVAGAAGPLGGDELRLDINVGPGAALVLRAVAATLVLPGPHDRPSRTEIAARVARDGLLVLLPGTTIAARNCRHESITRVMLEPGARLLLREELVLGRHGEPPGVIRQRLRVCLGDQPMHDQAIAIGPGAAGWESAAVTGGRRALGSALIVDPAWDQARVARATTVIDPGAALLPLAGPAALVTALAADALALRRHLDAGLAALETALSDDRV